MALDLFVSPVVFSRVLAITSFHKAYIMFLLLSMGEGFLGWEALAMLFAIEAIGPLVVAHKVDIPDSAQADIALYSIRAVDGLHGTPSLLRLQGQ